MTALLLTLLLALTPISGQIIRSVAVAEAVVQYFPVEARSTMVCIGYWETRQEPYSNDLVGAAGEVSWAQIHPIHFKRWPREWLRASVDNAAQAASQLYAESGFNPWSTYWRYCR